MFLREAWQELGIDGMRGQVEGQFDSQVCILVTGRSHGATSYSKESELGEEDEFGFDCKVPVGHPDRIVQQVVRYT